MGRPSLARERREQILDGMERCVAEHGLRASSLARIAAAAGVKTSLIAHYFGNRAGLMEALTTRVVHRYQGLVSGLLRQHEGDPRAVEVGLALLFSEGLQDLELARLSRELVAAARHDPVVRACVLRAHGIFASAIRDFLEVQFPRADPDRRSDVALGLLCLLEGSVQLDSFGLDGVRTSAGRAARTLIEGLGEA